MVHIPIVLLSSVTNLRSAFVHGCKQRKAFCLSHITRQVLASRVVFIPFLVLLLHPLKTGHVRILRKALRNATQKTSRTNLPICLAISWCEEHTNGNVAV